MIVKTPFVYWSQSEENIYLRIDVQNAQDIRTTIFDNGNGIEFSAKSGTNSEYRFNIPLAEKVENNVNVTNFDVKLNLTLHKKKPGKWNTLLNSNEAKRHWLKIDFNRWKVEDSEEELDKEDAMNKMPFSSLNNKNGNKIHENLPIQEMWNEQTKGIQQKYMMHRTYLTAYNICMLTANFYVLTMLVFGFVMRDRSDYLKNFWAEKSSTFVTCTMLQYMDVLHSATGLVKGNWRVSAIQVTGRLTMLMIIDGNPNVHSYIPTYVLVLVYFMGEQFRFPYYALKSMGISIRIITWLRYSHFLVFYPIGFLMEAFILVKSAIYYHITEKYYLRLPNPLNMSFNFGLFLDAIICIFPFAAYFLFNHMRKQRAKKLFIDMEKVDTKKFA